MHAFIRAPRHNLTSFFPRFVDHHRFFCSLGSFSALLVLFLCIRPSTTWLQQYDSQSRPRRAFPVIILLPGQSLPLPLSPLPLTLSPFYLAASPPGAERVLHPSLPVLIMLVSPTALPPPPLLRLRPFLHSALRRPPLARITSSFFKISRVSLYVPSITRISPPVDHLYSLLKKGTTVTLLTKTAKRYEGVITSTSENEGDTTGVTLRDVKEITAPGAPIKSQFFIASTNIDSWSPVPVNSNLSGPASSNSRADTKERTLLQTLAGLTVCDICK